MNINELRSLAEQAGFSGQDVGIAAAVAMAESSGNPDALGDTTLVDDKWGPSVGLWQIRALRKPQSYGFPDTLRVESALHDPSKNAAATYAIFKSGNGWKQWSTFTNGAYQAHLQAGPTPGASGMNERDLVIDKAKSYLGIHETGDNRTEFGKEFGEDGVAWCDIFVWCIFNRVGLVGLLPGKFDNCGKSTEAWRSDGRFSEYPGLGAQVVFGPGGGEHTGIVVSYTETTVTSVEGNWNDQVSLVTRERRDSYVYGYGYPRFAEGIRCADPAYQNQDGQGTGPTTLEIPVELPEVLYVGQVNHAASWDPPAEQGHRSYSWPQVLRLERALESEGLLAHPFVDGSFGTVTIDAYRQLQLNLGYSGPDADGKPGMDSLSWLGRRHGFRVEP
ncbi:transglycosylase SLT domain-containing protein [Kitasatospora sp. P5_F3]